MRFDKILVTTDFSESSQAAFDLSAYSTKMDGTEVTLLSVVDDWQVPEVFLRQIPNPESISQYRADLKQRNEEDLQKLAKEHFHGQDVKTEVVMTDSSAAEEICKYASENDIQLIVIASQGRGALGTLVLGSTVQKVVAGAPCPVLVVPKKKDS